MSSRRAQQNYKLILVVPALAILGQLVAIPALCGTISRPTPPDPILDGGPPGPCDPGTEGPDFVAGTDVYGNPVVSAHVGGRPIVVPQAVVVPMGRHHRGQAVLSGAQIAGLLNPAPACPGPYDRPRH
jgi:hypothetical protein